MSIRSKICCLVLLAATALPMAAQNNTKEKLTPGMLENVVVSGVQLYERDEFQSADEIFQAVIDADPSNDAAWYYSGLCRLMLRDVDGAETRLRKAVELDKSNFWYRQRLAVLYVMAGDGELAAKMYEELVADFPDKSELYYNLIEIYSETKQYDKALATLDKIETVFGESEASVMARYELLRNLGRHVEAFETLEEYNSRYSSPQVLTLLGDYEMSQYNDSTAFAYYEEALAIDPEYAPALLGQMEAHRVCRQYDKFFPEAVQFVSLETVPAAGKTYYLNMLVRQGDLKFLRNNTRRLDEVFAAAEQTHPADSSVLNVTAFYYLVTERPDEAGECFEKVVEAYPDDAPAAYALCYFKAYFSQWEEVDTLAEQFSEKFPEELGFLELRSSAAYSMGDYRKVIEINQSLVDAIDDDKIKVAYMANIGDMYHLLGESKKAYSTYEQCLKIDPDYLPALNNYAYYLSTENKKLKKAYTMSRKTIEAEPDNATYLDTYGWILYLQERYPEAKGIFKHAMLYGGKESSVILDHYAEVLFALEDYDLAFLYWQQALDKAEGQETIDLKQKIELRKSQMKK